MPRNLFRLSCAALAALTLGLAHARAQDAAQEMVVTATRIPTPLAQVASSVTVVTGDEIERRQERTLADVLRDVPGLSVTQLGGVGQQASVFARGANSNETLVLIDGIEANDPSAPNGAFDFAHLLPANVDRIEIVRGPESMLYGSQAIGAVVNIITRKGGGPTRGTSRIEGGSDSTGDVAASVAGALGKAGFSAGATAYHTDGEPILAPRVRTPGVAPLDAGYSNLTGSARLGVPLGNWGETSLVARYVRALTDLDPNLTGADPNARSRQSQYFSRLETRGHFLGGVWEPIAGLDYTRYDRIVTDAPDALSTTASQDHYSGVRYKADLQNNFHMSDRQLVIVGMEARTELLDENTNDNFGGFIVTGQTGENVDSQAYYLQDRYQATDRLTLTGGVRRDEHQTFGGVTTWRAAALYTMPETGTRLKVSYGTGFRAPALFELDGRTANNFGGTFTGNPALQPETSRGWEAGFDQSVADDRLAFGATYFQNRIADLIVCDLTTCNNTALAHTRGVETYLEAKLAATLVLRLADTYTLAEDNLGNDLLRRPKHTATFDLTYRPARRVRLGFHGLFVGRRRDAGIFGGTVEDSAYAVFGLTGAYDIDERVTLFARADNLFDRSYEVADGYRGFGRTVFAGVRAKF